VRAAEAARPNLRINTLKSINYLHIMKHFYLFLFFYLSFWAVQAQTKDSIAAKIRPENITIARDNWGVAHIFGRTNPEVAYGLAWANAEDAFEILQEALAVAKGKMGRIKGKEGAKFDYFVHAIGTHETVDSLMHTVSPEYLRYVEGYCAGVNAYAAAHPEQVVYKKLFPVVPKDILAAYIVSFSALGGTTAEVEKIVTGKYDSLNMRWGSAGSNAYAFNSWKTTDKKTYLAINPHFFVEGAFSFYEAHLCSEEGLNITGALFHGGTNIFLGNNEHLGWGHTYNQLDQVDVYQLKMHPKKKLYYQLDGKYYKLRRRPIWLKVKLGKITLPVRRVTYQSEHGMVLRSPDKKYFALRSPAFDNIRVGEQYYEMNKATNFDEFRKALRMNSLTMFNIVYADKQDNIYYLCNGRTPKRHKDYDFSKVVAGDSSKAIWTEYYQLHELPQVHNPSSGYVFNTNNTPANASAPKDNFPKEKVDKYMDLRPGDNNRAERFMELIAEHERFDFTQFKNLKFDLKFTRNSHFFRSISNLFALNPDDYPHIEEAIRIIQAWDLNCDIENRAATLFMLTLEEAFKEKGYFDEVFILGADISDEIFVRSIEKASAFLLKHHGSIKVPLGDVMSHLRNGKLHPASGFPDALSPAFGTHHKDGKYKMMFADTYIHFVKFNRQGAERIETLLPFELTRTCEQYEDELAMFNRREMKTMSLDKAEVLKKAKRIYNPIRRAGSE
jgi:acyl-homoserine-lactone acylase